MKKIILGLTVLLIMSIKSSSFAEELNTHEGEGGRMPLGRIGSEEKIHPPLGNNMNMDEFKGIPNGTEIYAICRDGKCSAIVVEYDEAGDVVRINNEVVDIAEMIEVIKVKEEESEK